MAAHKGVPPDTQAERDRRLRERAAKRTDLTQIPKAQEGSPAKWYIENMKAYGEEIAKRKAIPAKPKRGEKAKAVEQALKRLVKIAEREGDYLKALRGITGKMVADEVLRASGLKVTPRAARMNKAWEAFDSKRSELEEDEKRSRIKNKRSHQ